MSAPSNVFRTPAPAPVGVAVTMSVPTPSTSIGQTFHGWLESSAVRVTSTRKQPCEGAHAEQGTDVDPPAPPLPTPPFPLAPPPLPTPPLPAALPPLPVS